MTNYKCSYKCLFIMCLLLYSTERFENESNSCRVVRLDKPVETNYVSYGCYKNNLKISGCCSLIQSTH